MDLALLLPGLIISLQEFWAESFLAALLKFFLVVYTLVLVADLILLLFLRDLSGDLKKAMYGAKKPLLSEAKAKARFTRITERLDGGSAAQYKVALLEADTMACEILTSIGYKGKTMQEQLEQVIKSQLASKDKLIAAHQMRNRIVHEPDLTLTREEAQKWLEHYREFFLEVELFTS